MSRQFSEDMEVVNDVAGPAIARRMKKLKREHAAMKKFVTKLAALDLGNPDGLHPTQHWVDEARTLIRKEPR